MCRGGERKCRAKRMVRVKFINSAYFTSIAEAKRKINCTNYGGSSCVLHNKWLHTDDVMRASKKEQTIFHLVKNVNGFLLHEQTMNKGSSANSAEKKALRFRVAGLFFTLSLYYPKEFTFFAVDYLFTNTLNESNFNPFLYSLSPLSLIG